MGPKPGTQVVKGYGRVPTAAQAGLYGKGPGVGVPGMITRSQQSGGISEAGMAGLHRQSVLWPPFRKTGHLPRHGSPSPARLGPGGEGQMVRTVVVPVGPGR